MELFGEEKIKHIEEFMDFLAVFMDDRRYQEIKKELVSIEKERGEITMCAVAQALEEKGRILQLMELVESGDLTLQRAAEKANMTVEEFKERVRDNDMNFHNN